MLTESEYSEVKARIAVFEAWCATFPRKGQLITQDALRTAPCSVSNDERSAVEVYEFMRDKPDQYFVYVKNIDHGIATRRLEPLDITTWMGDILGRITSYGQVYCDNFGGKRQAIRVRAINECEYYGTYFMSAGDYARIRKAKYQKAA